MPSRSTGTHIPFSHTEIQWVLPALVGTAMGTAPSPAHLATLPVTPPATFLVQPPSPLASSGFKPVSLQKSERLFSSEHQQPHHAPLNVPVAAETLRPNLEFSVCSERFWVAWPWSLPPIFDHCLSPGSSAPCPCTGPGKPQPH